MYVVINGEEVGLYKLDTLDTVKRRYARLINVLPRFLVFSEDVEDDQLLDKEEFRVFNLIEMIESADPSTDPSTFYTDQVKDKFDITPRMFGLLWIIYQYDAELPEEQGEKMAVLSLLYELDPDYFTLDRDGDQQIDRDLDEVIRDLNSELVAFQNEPDLTEQIFQYDPIPISEFEVKEVTVEVVYGTNHDLKDVFNGMWTDPFLPFISLTFIDDGIEKNYYKIYKDTRPPIEWVEHDDTSPPFALLEGGNSLRFAFHRTGADGDLHAKDYSLSNVYISRSNSPEYKYEINIKFQVDTKGGMTQETLLNQLESRLGSDDMVFIRKDESRVKGSFLIPNFPLNKYAFIDAITSDPLISRFMYNIEDTKLVSQKSRLYVYYQPLVQIGPITELITFILIETTTDDIPPQTHLQVNISRAVNKDQIKHFKEIFSRLLRRFQQKVPEILDAYSKLIPGFMKESQKKHRRSRVGYKPKDTRIRKLRSQVPDLFIADYARKCTSSVQPMIISEDEVEKYEEAGWPTMTYPLYGEGEPHVYVCYPHEHAKYPGLRKSKLPNAKKYPYIPCCYNQDQLLKKTGRRKYELEFSKQGPLPTMEEPSAKKDHVIKTHKFLGYERLGTLPDTLTLFFSEFVPKNSGRQFFRFGVSPFQSKSSLIHCMQRVFDPAYQNTEPYILQKRKELASHALAPIITKQECYDLSDDEIVDMIGDDVYIDDRILRLLELVFQVNIFVFTRDDLYYPGGSLVIPRHYYTDPYVYNRIDPQNPTLFLYKHMGSEIDNATFPQFELIILSHESGIDKQFLFTGTIVSQIFTNFQEGASAISVRPPEEALVFNKYMNPNTPLEIDGSLTARIEGQYIDVHGKVRKLRIDGVDIYTDPLPPFPVPLIPLYSRLNSENSEDKVISWIKRYRKAGIDLVSMYSYSNERKGIFGRLKTGEQQNILIYIDLPLVNKGDKKSSNRLISSLPLSPPSMYPPVPKPRRSDLEIWNDNKRIARFLQQYTFYVFSQWWEDRHLSSNQELTPENLRDFKQEGFHVDPGHVYEILSKTIEGNRSFLSPEGKVYVPNERIVHKLIYVLYLAFESDRQNIEEYRHRKYLDDFVLNLSDFNTHDNEVILSGKRALLQWIRESEFYLVAHDNIPNESETKKEPYFFKNPYVENGRLFLVQNVRHGDLDRALHVAAIWEKYRLNLGFDTDRSVSAKKSYVVYDIQSAVNIQRTIVGDNRSGVYAYHHRLLKYHSTAYAAMLPL